VRRYPQGLALLGPVSRGFQEHVRVQIGPREEFKMGVPEAVTKLSVEGNGVDIAFSRN
jgi:hypothetical protein